MRYNSKMSQARELTTSVKSANAVQSNVIGSEVDLGMFLNSVPRMPGISYELNNFGVGVPTTFLIGDPTGMIAAILGVGTDPTSVQGVAGFVTPNKEFFYKVGIVYSGFNYLTDTNTAQFSQAFRLVTCNSAGEISSEGVNMATAQRNSAFNDKLLTLTGEYLLDIHRGITVSVLAGEVVTLTFTVSTYTV